MTIRELAAKRWPDAEIEGIGLWACVSLCRVEGKPTTKVSLWRTKKEAERKKEEIDETGCGGCNCSAALHRIKKLA
jgi:hypothetical protein